MISSGSFRFAVFTLLLVWASLQPAVPAAQAGERRPENLQRNVYFGDLHVHTAYSLDSFINLNPVGPREAYRFAMGLPVTLSGGRRLSIEHPLDFAAVTEHAEYLGELGICRDASTPQYESALCVDIRNESEDLSLIQKIFKTLIIRDVLSTDPKREAELCGEQNEHCVARARTVWNEIRKIANEFNRPGEFTTLVGYEWTGNPEGSNLHRNVIFRGEQVPALPISYFEASTPEQLWRKLQAECSDDCEVLAIPHNSNQSKGRQFVAEHAGVAYGFKQAALRQAMEPLVELVQAKGESECHTGIGTVDEFCNFEKLDRRPVCGDGVDASASDCVVQCDERGQPAGCIWARNYVRNALKDGLRLEKRLGVNPFKLGFIGGTDTHNGTPGATDESNYQGHHGVEDGTTAARSAMPAIEVFTPHRVKGSGGLSVVWAEENTRDGIFDALKRREAYATSGTRIVLRFFGGWDYPLDLEARDVAATGYAGGVPMGGDLVFAAETKKPRFLVQASRAVDGMKLERIQIVKGWLEQDKTEERVYDVACSDNLKPDPATHRCPDNGARVNLKDCSVDPGSGANTLHAVWEDPEFDPARPAFYYARVLENPSCRWTTYEAVREGKPPLEGVDAVIQERAWGSPIWYTPE